MSTTNTNSKNENSSSSNSVAKPPTTNSTLTKAPLEKYMFFTKDEISIFLRKYQDIILYMKDGTPYINYHIAKNVFESVVGYNYSLEILSYEYIHEFETFLTHVRITLCRDDKKIIKDVIGSTKAIHKKNSDEISNFEDLSKSSVKDAFKKFLSDYIGIGAVQFAEAKAAHALKTSQYNNNKISNQNNSVANGQSYTCGDCGVAINNKIYEYSTTYHKEKRALCPNCQKKY